MKDLYDVIVVGGGPAGLTAALYLARARYKVLVLEKEQFGGQISITHEVVNYPGITKISGKSLTDTMRKQAEEFGAQLILAEVTGFDLRGDVKTVRTDGGEYHCFGVLLATGAHPKSVGFEGEEKFKGRGVAYCATCDGEFFTGKEVFVVGGGYAAAEESVFLTKFAGHVTVLIRKGDFSCAASVAEQAKSHEKITVLANTVLEEVGGENELHYARYKNVVTGVTTEYRSDEAFGVFVFAGYAPATKVLEGIVELNEDGYIVTDVTRKTGIEGVYAAGDVCIKPLRQVITAASDGALAATELEKYVASMQRKTGLQAVDVPAAEKEPTAGISAGKSNESGAMFTDEMKRELDAVFSGMDAPLLLRLRLDDRRVSDELERFITELTALSDKLQMAIETRDASSQAAPCVTVCRVDGSETGLAFYGVPGGHEFTSFVLGLYNAAGPGQHLDEEKRRQINRISDTTELKILVTLSCGMCPDLVIAAQRIAAENINVTAHVYDVRHFEELRKRYNVMSVPCLVINDKIVSFGKKSIGQILDLINGEG